jgi:hypothetical protein
MNWTKLSGQFTNYWKYFSTTLINYYLDLKKKTTDTENVKAIIHSSKIPTWANELRNIVGRARNNSASMWLCSREREGKCEAGKRNLYSSAELMKETEKQRGQLHVRTYTLLTFVWHCWFLLLLLLLLLSFLF